MRYRLRTLLIVVLVLPPLIWAAFVAYDVWRESQRPQLRFYPPHSHNNPH
jgi:hypothetical protein